MRFTPNTILDAPTFLNPEHQRTLSLRSLKAPMIENFSVTKDIYEAIDLTDNDIRILGNLPVLTRLKTLLLAKNRINAIQDDFYTTVPLLESLSLSWNKITNIAALKPLIGCKRLKDLYLSHNPITKTENYRLLLIWLLPQVTILDFSKVKQAERSKSRELFGEPVESLEDLANSKVLRNQDAQSIVDESTKEDEQIQDVVQKLTDEDRAKLKQELKTATSLKEIDRIEIALKNGYI